MRNLVFLILCDVSRRESGIFIRDEDRVVAEAPPAGFLSGDRTFHRALELVLLAIQDEGHDTAEARLAADFLTGRLQLGEFRKHLVHIQIEIFGRSCVTSRIYSRSTSQRVHLQPRVVREAVAPFSVVNVACLLERVLLQGLPCLRDVLRDSEIRRSNQLKFLAQNLGSLSQLPLVARRENYFCHVV